MLVAIAFAALFGIGYPGLGAASSQYTYGYSYQYQYQTGHLIVIKHVVNDNGGTASASQFTMQVNGVTATGGNSFPGAESPGTNKEVTPGSYTVTETGPAGYSQSLSAGCSGSISAGQTKTCTVTNDDQAAHIVVIKHVINDNKGQSKAFQFKIKINGVTVIGTNPFPGAEAPGTTREVLPGSYTVTETIPKEDLYVLFPSADCTGTIALGQTKTCTLLNNDEAPRRALAWWKSHQLQTTALLPQKLGNYVVDTWPKALAIFNGANCGTGVAGDSINCLAAHLLATELNLANASDICIKGTVAKANTFLSGGTIDIFGQLVTGPVYTGPHPYTVTALQKKKAVILKDAFVGYNANADCQEL